jgi:hypothetical protein
MTPRRKPTVNQAQELLDTPTNEVKDAYTAVQEASAASESMSSAEFLQEDGSTLVVASFQGGEAEAHVFAPDEVAAVNPPVPDDAVPQGIQNDGTNTYDETGPPDGLVEVDA